jgi:hypothetical protein
MEVFITALNLSRVELALSSSARTFLIPNPSGSVELSFLGMENPFA